MIRPELLKSALIFAMTAVCVTAVIYHFAGPLLDLILPIYRVELKILLPAFHLDSLTWQVNRGETTVALTATLIKYRVVLGQLISPGMSISASTLAAHAWAPPVLMFALVTAWPNIGLAYRPLVILLTLPFAALVMLTQVPLMLWGAVEDLLYWQVDRAQVTESLGSRTQSFLDGGGRYALAFLFALMAIALFRLIVPAKAP